MDYKRTIKLMVVGETGSGKTHLSATFPKSFFLITEPGGEETWMNKPELRKNIVDFKTFVPESDQDTKRIFDELNTIKTVVKERAAKGEIETVVLDNATYLAENRMLYTTKYEPQYNKSGEPDTRAMYGALARWQYYFYLTLLSLPVNLIVTAHQKLESDEAMEKKPDKTSPVVASILGGFRDDMPGMFSAVFYIWKERVGANQYKYYARTNMGQGKMAKNRYGLSEVIENVSYDTIRKAVDDSQKGKA